MKRIICICIVVIIILCAATATSAYTPQTTRTYQSTDGTGVYSIRFNGTHADISRYSFYTLSAGIDLYSSIRAVCAYRGKIVLLCEDVGKTQLSVYVYYLDTDFLEGFVINNALLYNNTDFACDNDGIYIENYRDDHEVIAYSYSGSYLGRYRLDGEINGLFGGYRSGFYAVGGDRLYLLTSGRFTALSGSSVETPLFPADVNHFVSGYGKVYQIDGDQLSYAFSADADHREASACIIGNTLYFPDGSTISAYDLDTGEKIAYYRASYQIYSVYADGGSVIAVGDAGSVSISQSSFSLLRTQDEESGNEGSGGNEYQDDSGSDVEGGSDQRQSGSGLSVISSDVYQVDPNRYYITGIPPQTTVAVFKKNMKYDGYTLTIYRDNTVRKSGNVGTAMTAVFSSDEYIYTYELAVTGDITGEGNRNSRDLTTLMDYLIGSSDFNGVYTFAADLTNDGKVDVCDAAFLKSMI